jgi:hypothetical protein
VVVPGEGAVLLVADDTVVSDAAVGAVLVVDDWATLVCVELARSVDDVVATGNVPVLEELI